MGAGAARPPILLVWFMLLSIVGGLLGLLMGIIMRPSASSVIHHLWETGDPRAVGPLIDATQMMLPHTNDQAEKTLFSLLPRITTESAELLTRSQRHHLRKWLTDLLHDRELAGYLNAFTHVGSGQDLEGISGLVRVTQADSRSRTIRYIARTCITTLQQREREEKDPKRLLRAAPAPESGRDTLLRPNDGRSPEVDLQLLRPGERGDKE
jgi:hypothetical protein